MSAGVTRRGRSGGLGDDRRRRLRKSHSGDDVNPHGGPGEYQTDYFLVSDLEEEGEHDGDEDNSDDVGHRGGAGGSGGWAGKMIWRNWTLKLTNSLGVLRNENGVNKGGRGRGREVRHRMM